MDHIRASRARSVVGGHTNANDVSARDIQMGDGQWLRGKALDTFLPLGPAIVTPDEAGDPQDMPIRTRLSGETGNLGVLSDPVGPHVDHERELITTEEHA